MFIKFISVIHSVIIENIFWLWLLVRKCLKSTVLRVLKLSSFYSYYCPLSLFLNFYRNLRSRVENLFVQGDRAHGVTVWFVSAALFTLYQILSCGFFFLLSNSQFVPYPALVQFPFRLFLVLVQAWWLIGAIYVLFVTLNGGLGQSHGVETELKLQFLIQWHLHF